MLMRGKSLPYPLQIGAASIVPGLGLWLIDERDRAVQWGAIIVGLIGISLLLPPGAASGLTFTLAYILWLFQIGLAVRSARLAEEAPVRPEVSKEREAGVSYYQRDLAEDQAARQAARNLASGQLEPKERLIKALVGKNMSADAESAPEGSPGLTFRAPWYCVGLTQQNLVIIALDQRWKPIDVTRGDFRGGLETDYKMGWLSDELTIVVPGAEALTLEVSDRYRKQTRALIEVVTRGG